MEYFTISEGIGGRIKQRIEDFQVEEIPPKQYAFDHSNHKEPKETHAVFWMEKFNWDTHQAIRRIARKLHISPTRFGIAGTKDRRAVTKQRVSVWDIPKERLEDIGLKDIKIYNVSTGKKLQLGDLEGNKFVITIRDISFNKEEIETRLNNSFKEIQKGIPNLFGPQRFGEVRKTTFEVGMQILKGDLERAVKIYLAKSFPGEQEETKNARDFLKDNWNKSGFLKSLETFPQKLKYERAMLDHLYKNPDDYDGTLKKLPKKLLKMFVNSVQSKIFNRVAIAIYPQDAIIHLPGYDSKFGHSKIEKLILEEMEKIQITKKDFVVKSMDNFKTSGSERRSIMIPKDMTIESIEEDDFNENKIKATISFSLPKGSYATVVLNEITKIK